MLNIMSYGKQKYFTKKCCGSHRPGASSGRLNDWSVILMLFCLIFDVDNVNSDMKNC